jgi:hypothetical protein
MGRDVQLPARDAHVQRATRERGRRLRHPAPLVQGISATTDRVCQHLLAGRTRVDGDWANGPCALPTSTPSRHLTPRGPFCFCLGLGRARWGRA